MRRARGGRQLLDSSVGHRSAIVTYGLSYPVHPREASRLVLDPAHDKPHWIALDPAAPRLEVNADEAAWMLVADVNPETGALTIDERFRDAGAQRPGVTFDRLEWPHGAGGKAEPHGAVFGGFRTLRRLPAGSTRLLACARRADERAGGVRVAFRFR